MESDSTRVLNWHLQPAAPGTSVSHADYALDSIMDDPTLSPKELAIRLKLALPILDSTVIQEHVARFTGQPREELISRLLCLKDQYEAELALRAAKVAKDMAEYQEERRKRAAKIAEDLAEYREEQRRKQAAKVAKDMAEYLEERRERAAKIAKDLVEYQEEQRRQRAATKVTKEMAEYQEEQRKQQ